LPSTGRNENGAIVRDMATRLGEKADPAVRQWWERYLRGEASFRGVRMATARSITHDLWVEYDLEARTVPDLVKLAQVCMACEYTEDKLVGILLLAEHVMPRLELRHATRLARPLADGSLADWNSVDWYCVKCLGPFLVRGADVRDRASTIASWAEAKALWQRRAAAVAFARSAAQSEELFPGFHELLLWVCEKNVADPERWSQTSVGWVLRELSKHHPHLTRSFVDAHPELSREARKNAMKYI